MALSPLTRDATFSLFQVPLPDQQFVGEEEREELKEWVLALSMDVDVQPELAKDERGVFVGSLLDSNTGQRARPCIVSGYPVLSQSVEMKDNKVCCLGRRKGTREGRLEMVVVLGPFPLTPPPPRAFGASPTGCCAGELEPVCHGRQVSTQGGAE